MNNQSIMKHSRTRGHSRTTFKSIFQVRSRHMSNEFRGMNTMDGMSKQTPSFVNAFDEIINAITYGFTFHSERFPRDVLMRTVPSSKEQNIFFLLL
jgi:hypothetical protein